ncbi:hypothetical protein [Kingella sp. (in: b-proteobacteria)]|uniref:hypothetical protein n=1 Tax=Kingella sp. (in: b-proteobacteria) TaxID=2020713 RepID=UPI0026DBA741|nr:hypothetical protein [Kingella sp. (in: b-proteobacteria)]MDO4657906.1 hypothetical protein [Kingella sp. (in: b-proteobacteria)]
MSPVQSVYRLADLLAEIPPDGLPRVADWDEMPDKGKECVPSFVLEQFCDKAA